jgi:hypothetical protein
MLGFPLGILSAAGAAVGFESDYELISTTVLAGTAASVTFSNLGDYSSTYKHLQVRAVVRASAAGDRVNGSWRMNGDTGNNYAAHHLLGTGSSVVSSALSSQNRANRAMGDATVPGAGATANSFGAIVVDFLDVYSTTKNKTSRTLSGQANGSNLRLGLFSGVWLNTASVTSITLLTDDSGGDYNWVAGSRFSIYGLKG